MGLRYDDFVELAQEHYSMEEGYEEVYEQLFSLLVDAAKAYVQERGDGSIESALVGLRENLEISIDW